jgi:hypothetical protein
MKPFTEFDEDLAKRLALQLSGSKVGQNPMRVNCRSYWLRNLKLPCSHRLFNESLDLGTGLSCNNPARIERGPLSHFQGVAVGDGLTEAADSALESGLIVRTPAMSGVSIIPKVSMRGRVLRFLVGVQRSDVTPPMRILESP